jgi:hypothetical protein
MSTAIYSNTTYYYSEFPCGNLDVVNNSTLTINGELHMKPYASINVKSGCKIDVRNGGKIFNANIIVEPGGCLILQNNAYVEKGFNDEIKIAVGAIFDFVYGVIK